MVRDGYKFVLPLLCAGIAAAALGWKVTAAVLWLFCAGVAFFFRDPERVPPAEPGVVVSPADGRIMELADESVEGNPGQRISIFLSIWDVHVNRAPMAGRFREVEYRPGRCPDNNYTQRNNERPRTSRSSRHPVRKRFELSTDAL